MEPGLGEMGVRAREVLQRSERVFVDDRLGRSGYEVTQRAFVTRDTDGDSQPTEQLQLETSSDGKEKGPFYGTLFRVVFPRSVDAGNQNSRIETTLELYPDGRVIAGEKVVTARGEVKKERVTLGGRRYDEAVNSLVVAESGLKEKGYDPSDLSRLIKGLSANQVVGKNS